MSENTKETKKEEAKVVGMEAKAFNKLLAGFKSMSDEQKSQIREALDIKNAPVTAQRTANVRVNGSVKRTDKAFDPAVKCPPQMKILIDCLPTDKFVGIKEWGSLALTAGLKTQQPAERIAAYYKPEIIAQGYAEVEK